MKLLLPVFLAFWFIWTFYARADENAVITHTLQQFSNIGAGPQKDGTCWVGQEESGKTCSEISNQFCSELTDIHRGDSKVFDGQLRLGKSPKSKLSWAQLADYEALVQSGPNLPSDLKIQAEPILARLQKALASEEDTLAWKREIADIVRSFQHRVEDTALARRDALFPKLKGIKIEFLDAEDGFRVNQVRARLEDEILEAKYAYHPNWKRVQALFPEAKSDVLKVIETLPVNEAKKAEMKKNVESIELALPYVNPARMDADEECATTDNNAFYFPRQHKFTMCAGKFNTEQSATALLRTMLHEISHAIDPNAQAMHDCRNFGKVTLSLNRLVGAKGPAIECAEWEKVQKEILEAPALSPRRSELDGLYSCLTRNTKTKEWDQNRVREESELDAKQAMAGIARRADLADLSVPTHQFKGKPQENEFYLRPDRSLLLAKGHPSDLGMRDVDARELFTQALACQKAERGEKHVKFTDSDITQQERASMFRRATELTQALLAKKVEEEYSFCGQNCPGLKNLGLGKETGEHFADWVANRALRRHLARVPAGGDRRQASALAYSTLCEKMGSAREAPEIALEETKLARVPHPQDARRRFSFYDEITAGLVGCKLEPELLVNYGSCEP